jgi:hypothetical protein
MIELIFGTEHKDWGTLTMCKSRDHSQQFVSRGSETCTLSFLSLSPGFVLFLPPPASCYRYLLGLIIDIVFQQPRGQPGLQVFLPLSSLPSDTQSPDRTNNSEYPTSGQWGWFDAPVPPPGGFLVNVGLAMELWSGGIYKATLHRVIFPKPIEGEEMKDRYTFAYFVQPDDDVVCPKSSLEITLIAF